MNKLAVHVLSDPTGFHRWLVVDEVDFTRTKPIAVAGSDYASEVEARTAGEGVMKNIVAPNRKKPAG